LGPADSSEKDRGWFDIFSIPEFAKVAGFSLLSFGNNLVQSMIRPRTFVIERRMSGL
jgi:hypothetical protein